MCIDLGSAVGIGQTALGIIQTSRNRRRARGFAERQNELDQQGIDINRETALTRFAQLEIETAINNTRDLANIGASGADRGLSNRSISRGQLVSQNTTQRLLGNQRDLLEFDLQNLDLASVQANFREEQVATGSARPLDALDIGQQVVTPTNLNLIRSAFGLR